jgi:hypothetical protein
MTTIEAVARMKLNPDIPKKPATGSCLERSPANLGIKM